MRALLLARTKRIGHENFDALDRAVVATSWGVAIANDSKKRNARKWAEIRNRRTRPRHRGLTGQALEKAVMGIAQMFPNNVIQQ